MHDPPEQKHVTSRRLVREEIVSLKSDPRSDALIDIYISQLRIRNHFWTILHDEIQMVVPLSDLGADVSLGTSHVDDGATRRDIGPRIAGREMGWRWT